MKTLAVLLLYMIQSAATCLAQSPQWIGSAFPGPVFSLAVKNNLLYTGSGSMFCIYDISNPRSPVLSGHCHTTDCITYITVLDGKCFAGNNGMGIAEIDIHDPYHPFVKRYLYTDRVAGYNPAFENDTAFFPMGAFGLWAVNTAGADSLPFTHWGNTPLSHDFCIDVVKKDSTLYVTDRLNDIYILRYSRNTLSQISNYNINNYWSMECETDENQDYLYVTAYRVAGVLPVPDTLCLWVFDIRNPSAFNLIGEYKHAPIPSYPLDLKVKNNIAWIAAWSKGIIMVDVSNPANMHQCGQIRTNDASNWIDVQDTIAWTADLSAGVKAVDIRDTSHLQTLSKMDTLGDTHGVALAGDHIYTSLYGHGLEIALNYSGTLLEKPMLHSDSKFYAPVSSGNLLYIPAWDKGVVVYDLTDPGCPDSLTCIRHSGDNGAIALHISGTQMTVVEATYYLGFWRNCDIYVWDISSPGAPALLGSFRFLTITFPYDLPSFRMDRHGELIALCQWHDGLSSNFFLFDISNPGNIQIKDSISGIFASDARFFEQSGNLFCALTIGSSSPLVMNGLAVYDVSDPSDMNRCGFYPVGNTGNRMNGLDIYNALYAVTAEGGINSKGTLRIFNISDPCHPFIQDSLYIGSNTSNNHVLAKSDYIYHSSGSTGLILFSWDAETGIFGPAPPGKWVHAFPNPCDGRFTLSANLREDATVTIFISDVSGKTCDKIQPGILTKGEHNIRCDVSHLGPGVYLCRIIAASYLATFKMVIYE